MNSTDMAETTNDIQESSEQGLLFDNTNYALVILGVVFISLGFILMAGGGSSDPNVFDAEAIYSTRRITVAPILVILGFIIEIIAILKSR